MPGLTAVFRRRWWAFTLFSETSTCWPFAQGDGRMASRRGASSSLDVRSGQSDTLLHGLNSPFYSWVRRICAPASTPPLGPADATVASLDGVAHDVSECWRQTGVFEASRRYRHPSRAGLHPASAQVAAGDRHVGTGLGCVCGPHALSGACLHTARRLENWWRCAGCRTRRRYRHKLETRNVVKCNTVTTTQTLRFGRPLKVTVGAVLGGVISECAGASDYRVRASH